MRNRAEAGGVGVFAVAGSHVVLLAMNASDEAKEGLLGFALHRTDKTENEEYWLKGMRAFKSVYPNPPAASLVSTYDHPIQDFFWSDFTAKPDHDYVYTIVPVRGRPKALNYGTPIQVEVRTESEATEVHSVYFNRGVIGSQAYAREFHDQDPRKLTGKEQERAYKWLSRGLFEAMRDFVRQAKDENYGLRAAVYEFSYEPIIKEFRDAQQKCKDVKIVYDARVKQSKGAPDENESKRVALTESLLKKYKLSAKSIAKPRKATPNAIAHNKFIVLLENDKPVAVWTGSTNFTESGIFGQSNVGHVVRDEKVAQAYMDYWDRLHADPEVPALRKQNIAVDPDVSGFPPASGITPIFSPRDKGADKKSMLDWYANAMSKAELIMCFTAAFGVNKVFIDVLGGKKKPTDSLRYLFLEKWGVNAKQSSETEKAVRANPNNQVAVGSYLAGDVLHDYLQGRWEEECANTLSKNVRYTHTKYMLIDPLGEDPIVISGSANFSDASTLNNDENMLVIRGSQRAADIYLGEFMRLWQHYRFRSITNAKSKEGKDDEYEPNYLSEDDSWLADFYKRGTVKYLRRLTFMGLRDKARAVGTPR